jgi:hypothetical protein
MRKFVEVRKGARDSTESVNLWFAHCERQKVPYVTVTCRTKLADVEWDHISYPPAVDDLLSVGGVELRDAAITIFRRHARAEQGAEFTASDRLVSFRNLEIPAARKAAEELYDLVAAHVAARQTPASAPTAHTL